MKKICFFHIALFFLCSSNRVEYSLRDFKKKFAESSLEVYKDTGNRVYVDLLLKQVLNFAPKDMFSKWQVIVQQSKKAKDYESFKKSSCKTCHKKYKKKYKNVYRRKTYIFSKDLIDYLKQSSKD